MATKKRYYGKKNFKKDFKKETFKKETDIDKASRLSQELFSLLIDILDSAQNPQMVSEKSDTESDIGATCIGFAKAIVKNGSRIDPNSELEVCSFYCSFEKGSHTSDCVFTQAKAFIESNTH